MFDMLARSMMLSSNTIAKKVGTFTHKNADKILLGVGIGMICGGTVSAVVSSKNIAKVVDNHKKAITKTQKIEDDKERGHAKLVVYKDTAIDMLKTFGPCVLLTGTGIACIIGSHHILTQRLAATQAAYTMLDTSFREYRERVREKIGAEKEIDIFNNAEEHEIFEDNGDGKGVKKTKVKDEKGAHGPCDFLFKVGKNPNWTGIPERDRDWLYQRQWWAQDRLNREGELSVAEVALMCDIFEDKRQIPTMFFDMIWRRGDAIFFGIENDPQFLAGKKNYFWMHLNPSGFRRKLRKEERAMLEANRTAYNDIIAKEEGVA